jgi:eukaryotic-like serine/threonine-protein kinase
MHDDDFESRILQFELAWQRGEPPEIADFLELTGAPAPSERRRLLFELICVDLEFRWRNTACNRLVHEPIMLEGYTAKFPELGTLEQVPLELIGEEYRVRRGENHRQTA